MSIRNTLFAAAFALASLGAVHADGLQPIEAKSIDLGEVSGVAYYTIERDGIHVVTTLAQGVVGTPIRVVSVLALGQSVVLSTPNQAGAVKISRKGTTCSSAGWSRLQTKLLASKGIEVVIGGAMAPSSLVKSVAARKA